MAKVRRGGGDVLRRGRPVAGQQLPRLLFGGGDLSVPDQQQHHGEHRKRPDPRRDPHGAQQAGQRQRRPRRQSGQQEQGALLFPPRRAVQQRFRRRTVLPRPLVGLLPRLVGEAVVLCPFACLKIGGVGLFQRLLSPADLVIQRL